MVSGHCKGRVQRVAGSVTRRKNAFQRDNATDGVEGLDIRMWLAATGVGDGSGVHQFIGRIFRSAVRDHRTLHARPAVGLEQGHAELVAKRKSTIGLAGGNGVKPGPLPK